jgi:acetyl-CoA synthetase
MITPLPYAWATKPGSATLPFFGVQPVLLTEKGEEIQGPGERYCYIAWNMTNQQGR